MSRAAQQALLRARLADAGWETPAILELMPQAKTFYFDSVSQIRMPSWTRGRVALVGDAAACPSFLAGQGSALAMVEAYMLAAELARSTAITVEAFARYEQRLAPFLRVQAGRRGGPGPGVRAEEQAPASRPEHGDEADGTAEGRRSGDGQELPRRRRAAGVRRRLSRAS